jgi:hypothetical protein
MTDYIAILRSVQSVLHRTDMPRSQADQLGERIAQQLAQPHNLQLAAMRYSSTDVFTIGERAAKEYVALNS